jgi:hypothetical protein
MTIAPPQSVLVNAMAEVGGSSYSTSGAIAVAMCYGPSATGPWTAFSDEATNTYQPIAINVAYPMGTPPSSTLIPFTREGYQTGLSGTYYFALCGKRSDGPSGPFNAVGYSKVIGMIVQ